MLCGQYVVSVSYKMRIVYYLFLNRHGEIVWSWWFLFLQSEGMFAGFGCVLVMEGRGWWGVGYSQLPNFKGHAWASIGKSSSCMGHSAAMVNLEHLHKVKGLGLAYHHHHHDYHHPFLYSA